MWPFVGDSRKLTSGGHKSNQRRRRRAKKASGLPVDLTADKIRRGFRSAHLDGSRQYPPVIGFPPVYSVISRVQYRFQYNRNKYKRSCLTLTLVSSDPPPYANILATLIILLWLKLFSLLTRREIFFCNFHVVIVLQIIIVSVLAFVGDPFHVDLNILLPYVIAVFPNIIILQHTKMFTALYFYVNV